MLNVFLVCVIVCSNKVKAYNWYSLGLVKKLFWSLTFKPDFGRVLMTLKAKKKLLALPKSMFCLFCVFLNIKTTFQSASLIQHFRLKAQVRNIIKRSRIRFTFVIVFYISSIHAYLVNVFLLLCFLWPPNIHRNEFWNLTVSTVKKINTKAYF